MSLGFFKYPGSLRALSMKNRKVIRNITVVNINQKYVSISIIE